MSERRDADPLQDPQLTSEERHQLARIDERLNAERPIPRPAFRGALGRTLQDQLEPRGARSRRARRLVAAYAGSGLCLLAVAALGVAGAGPLAA